MEVGGRLQDSSWVGDILKLMRGMGGWGWGAGHRTVVGWETS